jgi:hypothetical protein
MRARAHRLATGCSIAPITNLPGSNFFYQTTDRATNQLTGTPNTPVDINAGSLQTFFFALLRPRPDGAMARRGAVVRAGLGVSR